MPILKRVRLPLYYKNNRKNSICFELLDKTLFIRPEDFDMVDAQIDAPKEEKTTLEKQKKSEKKQKQKQTFKGEWKITIKFHQDSLTRTKWNRLKSILSSALNHKKAKEYFKELVKDAAEHSMIEPTTFIKTLEKELKKDTIYRFRNTRPTKQMNSITFKIKPSTLIPRTLANKEMVENFMYNVAHTEISEYVSGGVESVSAELK